MIKLETKEIRLASGAVVKIRKLNMLDFLELDMIDSRGEVRDLSAKDLRAVIMRAVVEPRLNDEVGDNSIYALSNDDLLLLISEIFEFSGLKKGA